MINVEYLTLIDGLGYALDDIKEHTDADEWDVFNRWFGKRPHYLSQAAKKCIHKGDLQFYIRMRTNAIKGITIK